MAVFFTAEDQALPPDIMPGNLPQPFPPSPMAGVQQQQQQSPSVSPPHQQPQQPLAAQQQQPSAAAAAAPPPLSASELEDEPAIDET